MNKTELRVFLASPGGLELERDAVEQLAGVLNANFSDRLNVTIIVRRFEQRAARSGRPQAQINPWVDDCDLLIAIVHRRWGSPSGQGDQTGFSEEFDRGIERFEATGNPVVSLHFKAVDSESQADAGPQLAQVMAFRRRIETDHVGLYKNFDSLDGLKLNIMQLLLEEMHAASNPSEALVESSSGSAVETKNSSVETKNRATQDSSGIAEVLEAFAEVIRTGESNASVDLDRLTLFASGVARDEEVASVHLVNRIFDRRRTTSVSEWELSAWFRAYVSDHGRAATSEDRIVPFVLAVGRETIESKLLSMSSELLVSDIDFVQKGYLRLLTAHRLRPETLWPSQEEPAAAHWLKLANGGLRMEALAYWATVASDEDVAGAQLLDASDDPTVASFGAALVAIVDAEKSTDPLLALDAKAIVNISIHERLGAGLLERASTTVLEDFLRATYLDMGVRRVIIPEIARRGAWPVDVIKTLINLKEFVGYFGESWEHEARKLLFATAGPEVLGLLIEGAKSLEPREATKVFAELASANTMFRSIYLAQAPDHLATGNIDAYFALHTHDKSRAREANQVIAGTFEPAKLLMQRLQDSEVEEKVLAFVRESHIASALTYLVRSGSSMTAAAGNLLRSVAQKPGRFRYEMLILLEEIAKDGDIPTLLDSTPSRWRNDSARLARLLSRATLSRLNSLLDDDLPDIVLVALQELARRDRLPSQRVRKILLRHADPKVRFLALSTLANEIADTGAFVDDYIHSAPTYYYNVVCELDRIATGSPKAH